MPRQLNVEVRDFEQVVGDVFVGSYRVWQIKSEGKPWAGRLGRLSTSIGITQPWRTIWRNVQCPGAA
jgi:hypothetical protein